MGKIRIIWGLNPFQDEPALRNRCRAFLRSLGRGHGTMEPAYVFSPAEFQIPPELAMTLPARYRESAIQKLKGYLKGIKGLKLRPFQFIESEKPSIFNAAKCLADYAHMAKADLLVLGTHARSGLAKFVLGSFAQTLVSLSRTPVVLIKPKAKISHRIRRVLFASDLTANSLKAFEALCRIAAPLGASIEILNVLECPTHWATTRSYLLIGPKALTPKEYVEGLKRSRTIRGHRFLEAAERVGVKATFQAKASSLRPASVLLKRCRETGAEMIALASQSNHLRASLLGSVSREILRGTHLPVWTMRVVGK